MEDKLEIGKRVEVAIKQRFGSRKNYCEKVGITVQQLSRTIKNGSIGLDFVIKLVEEIPDLDLNWLVFGNGNSFFSDREMKEKEPSVGLKNSKDLVRILKEENLYLKDQVAFLQAQILRLQDQLFLER